MDNDTLKFGEDLQRKLTRFTTGFIDYIKTKRISAVLQTLIENLHIELLIWSSAPANEVDASLNYNLDLLQITPTQIYCIDTNEEVNVKQLNKLIQFPKTDTYVFSPISEISYNNTQIFTDSFCVMLGSIISGENQTAQKIIASVLLDFLIKCLNTLDALTETNSEIWKKNEQRFNFDIFDAYVKKVFCELPIPCEDIIKGISYQYYEKSEISSSICLIDDKTSQSLNTYNEPGLVRISNENDPAKNINDAKNISYIRKLLEACKNENVLLASIEKIPPSKEDGDQEEFSLPIKAIASKELSENIRFLYKLEFKARGEWRLRDNSNIILEYKEGRYYICERHFKLNILDKVKKIKQISSQNQPLFEKIFECLYQCPHGTLMIVGETSTIQPEAKRLSALHKGTMITNDFDLKNPKNLPVVQGLASIDGAVMVDYNGICHGFGVILDGEAVIKGETGRGSRYNSAQNYAALHQEYAVVFSEDKDRGIDVMNGTDLAAKLGLQKVFYKSE